MFFQIYPCRPVLKRTQALPCFPSIPKLYKKAPKGPKPREHKYPSLETSLEHQEEMADDYETHVDVPLEPAVRRLLLERRASRSEDLPEELDGFRYDRRRSVDYKDLKDYRNLAEEEKQTPIAARPVGTRKA